MDSLLSVKLELESVFTHVATAMQRHPTQQNGADHLDPILSLANLFLSVFNGFIGGFRSYCDQNPTLIFQIFLIDFIPGLQTSKFRWGKNTEDSD